jgi:hypothetical protein
MLITLTTQYKQMEDDQEPEQQSNQSPVTMTENINVHNPY